MWQSKNVLLRRASDAPLRRLRDRYGGEEQAEAQLEQAVLAGERRLKGRTPSLCSSDEGAAQHWITLTTLLADLSAYGALGAMGGADVRFCRGLQPLLTRLMKAILNGGFEVTGSGEESEDAQAENLFDAEALLQATCKALANCSEGVARRCADTTLEVQLDDALRTAEKASGVHRNGSPASMEVSFGFADYVSGETGAMLWAGAVGLSLFLTENFETCIAARARDTFARTGQPLRVIELGCGPALVSLTTATLAAQQLTPVPCVLDVTDVSPAVVREAAQSFKERNGATVSRMLLSERHLDEGDAKRDAAPDRASCHVRPFVLDFSDIPSNLHDCYDVVVASDVVYDHAIAAHVGPALERLLKPGGVALLCCEAHRDGMTYFSDHLRAGQSCGSQLRVAAEVPDVQRVLTRLQMLSSLTASTCALLQIERICPSRM